MQIATPIGMGFGQNEIVLPTQADMIFVITPAGIGGADERTRQVIRQTLDNINAAFQTQVIPIEPPVINAAMVTALQELARAAAQVAEVTDREAAAIIAPRVSTPESVRANLVAIKLATDVLGARFKPLPAPGLPALAVRRESGIALAGVLFLGLLALGAGTYFWIVRPTRG